MEENLQQKSLVLLTIILAVIPGMKSVSTTEFSATYTIPPRDRAEFSCSIPEPYWFHNSSLIDVSSNIRYNLVKKTTLKIKGLRYHDAGIYECSNSSSLDDPSAVVYNRYKLFVKQSPEDGKSNSIQSDEPAPALKPKYRHPNAPKVIRLETDEPLTIVKTSGRSVRMHCSFHGDPTPTVSWLVNGRPFVERPYKDAFDMNQTHLYIENLAPNDAAKYTCLARNPYGTDSLTYTLMVTNFRPSAPVINPTYMRNLHVVLGQNVTWKCHSESDLSKITQWFRWITLENGTEDRVVIPTTVPEQLSIIDVKKSDLGTYGCLVVNSIGHDILNVTLEEDLQHHLPVILKDKENQRIRFLATIGAFFIFAVLVTIFALRTRRKLKDKRVTIIQAKQSFIIRKKVIVEQRDSDKALLSPNIKIEEERVHVDPQDQESGKVMNQYQFQLDPRWEISRSCLDFDPEPLGEGAFGIVYKADAFGLIPNTDRVEVAVKMLKNGHSDTDLRDLVTEMELMKKVQGGHTHKNIINLLGCITQDGPLAVIVEYAPNGNLRDFLQKRKSCWEYAAYASDSSSGFKNGSMLSDQSGGGKLLSLKKLINYGYQIAQGMEYLGSKNCIHRDLAARNVLVMSDETLKIADFGLARDIYAHDYYRKTTHGRLPVKWMAPETLSVNKYTSASDVWSFGITFWEITTLGETPYSSIRHEDLPPLIKKGYRLSKPTLCPKDLYHLMHQTWQYDPLLRPSFPQIVLILEKMLMNGSYLDLVHPTTFDTAYDSELDEFATEMDSLKSTLAQYVNHQPLHNSSSYSNQEVVQQQMNRMNPVYFSDTKCWQEKLYEAREDVV